jgi:serine protease Do
MRFLAGLVFVAVLASVRGSASGQQPDNPSVAAEAAKSGSYLGIGVADVDSERLKSLNLENESGVQILRLLSGGPAEKAGLKPGDILLSYNGENILGGRQLGRLVSETPAGRRVKIKYWREGNVQSCVVTTAIAPEAGSDFEAKLRDQMNWLRSTMPMDVPTPLLVWRNRILGIVVEPLDPQLATFFGVKEGVLVRYVDKSSPAEAGGMRSGDVLTAIGKQVISNPRDVSMCIRNQTASKQVTVSLVRDHKPLKLAITPAEYPQ